MPRWERGVTPPPERPELKILRQGGGGSKKNRAQSTHTYGISPHPLSKNPEYTPGWTGIRTIAKAMISEHTTTPLVLLLRKLFFCQPSSFFLEREWRQKKIVLHRRLRDLENPKTYYGALYFDGRFSC